MGAMAVSETDKMPRQIPFIIGNEACERFSFYGMKNILTAFLIEHLLLTASPDPEVRKVLGTERYHLFIAGVYFFPLLGGYLADRWFGKYRTIFWLSLLYCAGHACLALFEKEPNGFYLGLGLIALGSGGIKPCVSAMVGDQFTDKNKHLLKVVFSYFYFSINFGSFFATLLIPLTLKRYGAAWAFGIPGVLMFIATFILWLGRKSYVHVPPSGPNPHSFFRVLGSAIRAAFLRESPRNEDVQPPHARPRSVFRMPWRRDPDRAPGGFLAGAEAKHPADAVEGARAVLRIVLLLSPIPVFWMLFDQKGSTWIVQAKAMNPVVGPITFEPSQIQFINPALVMILIPLTTGLIYPAFKRFGYELTALRRMTIGLFLGVLAFVAVALINVPVEAGQRISILWQAVPYLLLTTAEVLVSTTGLEFAYSQAPLSMKGTIMSFWNLTVTIANLSVVYIVHAVKDQGWTGTTQFLIFAGICLVGAVSFGLLARSYKLVDHFRKEGTGPKVA